MKAFQIVDRVIERTLFYRILERPDGRQGIQCRRCGLTSWHPEDVEQRYCAHCHRFHDIEIKNLGVLWSVFVDENHPGYAW